MIKTIIFLAQLTDNYVTVFTASEMVDFALGHLIIHPLLQCCHQLQGSAVCTCFASCLTVSFSFSSTKSHTLRKTCSGSIVLRYSCFETNISSYIFFFFFHFQIELVEIFLKRNSFSIRMMLSHSKTLTRSSFQTGRRKVCA